eukprot:9720890-Prorocentrum_lima.AAC.1
MRLDSLEAALTIFRQSGAGRDLILRRQAVARANLGPHNVATMSASELRRRERRAGSFAGLLEENRG